MSKIGRTHLVTVDAVGHGTDGEHAVGQRFPIGPPFGLVAMAWRDEQAIDGWLHRVTPRLTDADIAAHLLVLAEIRDRGYGAWRFDAAHTSLHDRLAAVLASLEPTTQVTRELNTLMTIVTLQSVTGMLETELSSTEFVVLPVFGRDGQPEYQIEIHLGGRGEWSLPDLDDALHHAQALLRPGVARTGARQYADPARRRPGGHHDVVAGLAAFVLVRRSLRPGQHSPRRAAGQQ
jgi:hypothetical protein